MRHLAFALGLMVSLNNVQAQMNGCADLSGTFEVTDANCELLEQSGSASANSAPGFSSPIEWPCKMKDESGSARAARFQPGTNLVVSQTGCEEVSIQLINKVDTTATGYTFGGEERVCTIGKNNEDWIGEFKLDSRGLQYIDNRTYRIGSARRHSKSKSNFRLKKDLQGNLIVEHDQSQVVRERLMSADRSSSSIACKFKLK